MQSNGRHYLDRDNDNNRHGNGNGNGNENVDDDDYLYGGGGDASYGSMNWTSNVAVHVSYMTNQAIVVSSSPPRINGSNNHTSSQNRQRQRQQQQQPPPEWNDEHHDDEDAWEELSSSNQNGMNGSSSNGGLMAMKNNNTKYQANGLTTEKKFHDDESDDDSDDDDDDDDHFVPDEALRQTLLRKVQNFTLPVDVDKGYKATTLHWTSFRRPHMRTFHASWICFFCSWLLWFSMSPLLPYIQESTHTSDGQVATTNLYSMVGTVVLRLLLGPMCDKYGARTMLTGLLAVCALPLFLSGLIVHNYTTLLIVRFWIGCVGGTLVPAQYWITAQFVRDVCGKSMAMVAGWGAMGGGVAQLFMGTILFPFLQTFVFHDENDDMAWRIALMVPSGISLCVAAFFYSYSDDCPLGNLPQLQRAGLVQEKSAIDSFRSGAVNLNAWILFLQFGASLGIELTMESNLTLHLAHRFSDILELNHAAAYASLFGLMNIFSRGLGGIVSDMLFQKYSLRGRLYIHMVLALLEGIVLYCFVNTATSLSSTIVTMIGVGILGQMSMGSCFGIVPYVDGPNTGTIAGIVGAGGNMGAIVFLNVYKQQGDTSAFEFMALCCIISSILTPLIIIKGFRGIIFGKEKQQQQQLTRLVGGTRGVGMSGTSEGTSLLVPVANSDGKSTNLQTLMAGPIV